MDIDAFVSARIQQANNTIQARMSEIASSTGILFSTYLTQATDVISAPAPAGSANDGEIAVVENEQIADVQTLNYVNSKSSYLADSQEIENLIVGISKEYGIDDRLIRALIKLESNFNPDAVSPKGAMGLMQLMPATAESLGVENPYDPEQNIDGGIRCLYNMLTRWDGDVKLALASYNCGANGVSKRGITDLNDPEQVSLLPKETQNYLTKIQTFLAEQGAASLLDTKVLL